MNLHGPVRAPQSAGPGTATLTISLPAWKDGEVAATTHQLDVLRPKVAGKSEPVSPALVASLVHPDRSASAWGVQFSADGKRLFTAGYPSGIIQIWDVANRQEVRKVESPRGYRGSADYALLAPDWKALYVPVEVRKVKTIEKGGKKTYRFEYSGEVRAWDLASGKSLPAIKPPAGCAPAYAKMSPDGKYLAVVERPSFDRDEPAKDRTVLITLADGTRRVLCDGFAVPAFSADGKRVAVSATDYDAKKSVVRLFDTATCKELGRLDCPDKERTFSLAGLSADGSVVAVDLGGKLGADREVWFLDAATMKRRARCVGQGDPDRHGWGPGGFSPDGKRYFAIHLKGVDLIDTTSGKVVKTLEAAWGRTPWRWALSADGRYLAAAWMPQVDKEREQDRSPDPRDLPQPRVSLFDLEGDAPPRVLIAPHGYVGGVAFAPDGKALAFGGAGAVHLFDLTKK